MNSVEMLLDGYALLVALASLLGGWLLLAIRLTHARLQVVVSLVAGLMLSMALLHFIPHTVHQTHSLDRTMQWVLAGILTMFFLQRFLPYHHHDVPEGGVDNHLGRGTSHETHAAPHHSASAFPPPKCLAGRLSWIGTVVGMSLHSVMGGFAIAAAVLEESGQHGGLLLGLGTAVVIVLHKPFDAVVVSTVMAASGCSQCFRHLVNGLFALVTPLGIFLLYLGASRLMHMNPAFLGGALAFCAGTFLCIAGADLLPELQFHSHDRFKLSLALAAGIGIAVLIGQLERFGHEHHEGAAAGSKPEPGLLGQTGVPKVHLLLRQVGGCEVARLRMAIHKTVIGAGAMAPRLHLQRILRAGPEMGHDVVCSHRAAAGASVFGLENGR